VADNQPAAFGQNKTAMNENLTLEQYAQDLGDAIRRESMGLRTEAVPSQNSRRESETGLPDPEFNELALCLFQLQLEANAAYAKFCRKRGGRLPEHWTEIPAVPALAFKEWDLTAIPPEERIAVFHSSGTTSHRPSRHYHHAASLALYEASLLPWFERHLEEAFTKPNLLFLTPPRDRAPHSSLVYMFDAIRRRSEMGPGRFLGEADPLTGEWRLDSSAVVEALEEATRLNQPVALLGTAFNLVHLLDGMAGQDKVLFLPAGSRVMETGGYKGRSRFMPKDELHKLVTERLGIPSGRIVCEYGMSELSSQAYDQAIGLGRGTQSAPARVFHFPPWARARLVAPGTNREVGEGETGLIRIYDLANAWSALAVQTEDLGIRRGAGFEWLGRAARAEPRGCSLQAAGGFLP
jgi:Acyl-protein synthetase, LuxE